MRRHFKKWIITFIVLTLLFSVGVPAAAYADDTEEGKVVTVAFPDAPGLSESHADGTYSGIFYDWLVEIAKYTGWEYEFIEGDTSELMDKVSAGEIDLMSGMFYIPGLEEMYRYPSYSVGASSSLLLKRSDDNSVQGFDIATLNGKTIGVYKNAVQKTEQLKYFMAYNSISSELREFDDSDEMGRALDNGEIDVMLGADSYLTEGRSVAFEMGANAYYIVTSMDEPELCRQLDEAITEIYEANPEFAREIHARYFDDTYDTPIFLSDKDKAFIAGARPVRVALMRNRYPLSYNVKKEQRGICLDIFELISKQTGLTFKFVYADTYQEMLNLIKEGKADISGFFMDDEETAKGYGMVLSKYYVDMDRVIVKNKKVDYPSEDLTLALTEGLDVPEEIEPGEIVYCPAYEDCLAAVEQGQADVTFLPSALVEELFYQNYYGQVAIVASNMQKSYVCAAVPKPVNVRLFSVLNKAINSIPSGEIDNIVSRNLESIGEQEITIESMVYSNPVMFISIIGGFLFLAALTILLYGRFKMKSSVMKIQLEKAEESSQAKSEFLSRMSHEIRTPLNAITGLTQVALDSSDLGPKTKSQLEKIQTSSQFLMSLVNDILDMSKIESSKMKLSEEPFKMCAVMEQAESMMRIQSEKKGLNLIVNCSLENQYFVGDMLRIKQVLINLLSNAVKFTGPGGTVELSLSESRQEEDKSELLFHVKDTGAGIEQKDMSRIFESFEQAANRNNLSQGTGLGLAISSNLIRLMGGEICVESTPGKGSDFHFSIWLPKAEPFEERTAVTKDEPVDLGGMRILLAEDNDLNAEIVVYILEEKKAVVERARDGQETVDKFCGHPAGYYQLILMDIQMPVKSGLTAAIEIREMDRADAKEIPIIAMTANTFKEDRDKAMDAGMNGFVPKPFDVKDLYEAIEISVQKK